MPQTFMQQDARQKLAPHNATKCIPGRGRVGTLVKMAGVSLAIFWATPSAEAAIVVPPDFPMANVAETTTLDKAQVSQLVARYKKDVTLHEKSEKTVSKSTPDSTASQSAR